MVLAHRYGNNKQVAQIKDGKTYHEIFRITADEILSQRRIKEDHNKYLEINRQNNAVLDAHEITYDDRHQKRPKNGDTAVGAVYGKKGKEESAHKKSGYARRFSLVEYLTRNNDKNTVQSAQRRRAGNNVFSLNDVKNDQSATE